jgi:hypothetical protein
MSAGPGFCARSIWDHFCKPCASDTAAGARARKAISRMENVEKHQPMHKLANVMLHKVAHTAGTALSWVIRNLSYAKVGQRIPWLAAHNIYKERTAQPCKPHKLA